MRLSEGGRCVGVKVCLQLKGASLHPREHWVLAAAGTGLEAPRAQVGAKVADKSFHLELTQGTEVRLQLRKLGKKR